MLAARLNPRTLEFSLVDLPVPEPGPGEVRIKVEAAGVCLSDVHLIEGIPASGPSCARPTWSRTRSPWGTKWPGRSTRWDRERPVGQ